jgi:hypothetical protein
MKSGFSAVRAAVLMASFRDGTCWTRSERCVGTMFIRKVGGGPMIREEKVVDVLPRTERRKAFGNRFCGTHRAFK